MDFKEEKLPIYNDTLVFNDLMNRGFYNVLNCSDLSDDYILDNINFIIKIIRNGQYILSSNSPKNIKNNYLFYVASFDAGNINPLFFYRGNIKDLDDYFKKNPSLMENIIDIYNNKFKLKKIIDFNSYISVLYFGLLNKKIVDGLIDIRNCTCLDKIIPYLNSESIKKMYGQNVFDFTSRYGYHIILNGKYKYISKLSSLQLNKFYSVFELRNGHVQNLTNLYNALVEYNFVYKSSDDILNGQSFSLIKKDNIDYVYALVFEISKYLSKDDKEKIISEYGSDIYKLFDKYMNLYGSNNYKEFNKYSSIIRNICSLGYNRKREKFILSKNNLENGFPFDIELSPKMRRIINKKKLMQKTCLDIAYDMNKLNKLKEYLVNKGYINNDFDTNILFALLTDGVKSVKLIEFDIDINYLMGKILNYVSLSIDNALIDDSVPFEEYKNLPLNDDCFVVKSDIKEIVNKIDLENFFENVINNEEKYDLFKKYIDKYDILYFVDALKLTDVSYSGNMSYSIGNIISLIDNFADVSNNLHKNVYGNLFDMLKNAFLISNPLYKYERIFGKANKWIINDPSPHSSLISPKEKIAECIDIYKNMLAREFVSVPVYEMKCDGLTITNNNFYDENILVTGEKLGSCLRAGGSLDDLFRYTLLSPNGFNIVIKDTELISRIAGVCLGNTIFLNELREDVNSKYDNEYLFKILKKYILSLVKESYKNGHIIEQVFIPWGMQGTRNIKDNIVKSDMFLDLKIGKYGFKMDYEDSAILLYGDSIKSIKTNYSYYNIPRFKTLSGEESIKRINMLRCLYNNEWDYIPNFDYSVCSNNWYVYVINGKVFSYIYGNNNEEYENTKGLISIKKSI